MIKIIQRDMPVSAIIEKLIGNAIIAIGILQLDMPAENVVKNDSRKPFIQIKSFITILSLLLLLLFDKVR